MNDTPPLRIAVAGAGAVGCFCGGLLASAGHRVTLLGRPRVLDAIAANGLHLTDYSGLDTRVPVDALSLSDEPACLSHQDLIIVAVKSNATAEMAEAICKHAASGTTVLSFQNGMTNAEVLQSKLPDHDVRAAMVPFNVVPKGAGQYHRASSGDIVIGTGPNALAERLSLPALPISETARISDVQWGKLLINLNNAVNALSGLPMVEQLGNRAWRKVMAAQMREALTVYAAQGITPISPAPVPTSWLPVILGLPTPLFRRVASAMLSIDPEARLSMAQDLQTGRTTEVDELQGHILRMAEQSGLRAPVTRSIRDAIKTAEAKGPNYDRLGPDSFIACKTSGGDRVQQRKN